MASRDPKGAMRQYSRLS